MSSNSEFTAILKSAMEGEFTPWKLANATNQDLFSQITGCYILPAYHWLGSCSQQEADLGTALSLKGSFEEWDTSVMEENVGEGKVSQRLDSTHRNPLGSQRQQVFPQNMQGPFIVSI